MKSKTEKSSYTSYRFTVLGESVVSGYVLLIVVDEFFLFIENDTSTSNITTLHRMGSS